MGHVGRCQVCDASSFATCSSCYQVSYCGREHQKSDWKRHKKDCSKPWTLKQNAEVGRYLVASRTLRPLDVILRERPLAAGPNVSAPSRLVCVECLIPIQESTVRFCPACRLPVCSEACLGSQGHTEGLCKVFKRCPDVFYGGTKGATKKPNLDEGQYQLLLPTRVALLRRTDVRRYKAIKALQSHREERRGGPHEKRIDSTVVKPLLRLGLHESGADAGFLQEVCGIFDTNGFDLHSVSGGLRADLTGLYETASMLMHSCRKNVRITFSRDHVMTVMAAEEIRRGATLCYSYSDLFVPTNLRRIMLFTGKMFSCECPRCLDPTELGSFASALRCPDCPSSPSGNTENAASAVLPDDPVDLESPWRCSECGGPSELSGAAVAAEERRVQVELEGLDREDEEELEDFLSRHSTRLHPRHAFLTRAKQLLAIAYGKPGGGPKSKKKSERRIMLCRGVMEATERLEAPFAVRVGLAAFDLASALASSLDSGGGESSKRVDLASEAASLFGRAAAVLGAEAEGTECAEAAAVAKGEEERMKRIVAT